MKKTIIATILSLAIPVVTIWLTGCDTYKEDNYPVIDYSLKYNPNQPYLVNLGVFINPENNNSFKIMKSPISGEAEILKSSYLKYAPNGNLSDQMQIEIVDQNNNKIGEAKINLEASESNCGFAIFDFLRVNSGSSINTNLADNDLLCEPIGTAILQVTYLENWAGLKIEIPRPDPIPQPTKIQLKYNAPVGFTGRVRALYTVAINIKDEYADKWATGEELITHPEYFKYYVSSMVEIEVVDE